MKMINILSIDLHRQTANISCNPLTFHLLQVTLKGRTLGFCSPLLLDGQMKAGLFQISIVFHILTGKYNQFFLVNKLKFI